MTQVNLSENFKKMTVRAIASIALFIFTYFVLVCLAFVLVGLCGIIGFALVAYKFHSLTAMLAVGLVSMGVLILIFLLKFIFNKHVTDRSHLTEISRAQEPALFSMIEDIVKEVDTDFPKRVYVSSDVNASVFYDSSFWSMFWPVKKNLHIGIGLVNTVSVTEFRAILAHEFGHFSQRTMKVGSYVYNVNQVIYNMLYDNSSYEAMAQKWGNFSSYLTVFVGIAVKIVQGIQWILRRMYDILNLSYMSLSREMEFHADEVAANVVGSAPLITSLLRMNLADHSYNEVLQYYNGKIGEGIRSRNIYPEQTYVMNFLADKSKLPFENNLPQVTLNHLSRYNKSKLVISDQWASHPSTEDRVLHLEKLNLPTKDDNLSPASGVFSDMAALQVQLTEKLFSDMQDQATETLSTGRQFMDEFRQTYEDGSFHDLYNGYYDDKNPVKIQGEETSLNNVSGPVDLYTSDAVDNVYLSLGIASDMNLLRNILNGNYPVKSFDYDGVKYTAKDCAQLIPELEGKLEAINKLISGQDARIYQYFTRLATQKGKQSELEFWYSTFQKIDQDVEERVKTNMVVVTSSAFIFETTPFELIRSNLKALQEVESEFKVAITSLLADPLYQESIAVAARAAFNNYLSEQYPYFYDQEYKSSELDILFAAINEYQQVLSKAHFRTKKKLLDFKVELVD